MLGAAKKNTVAKSVHRAICALLSLALFSAMFADIYIHVAHAGHPHAPHELSSASIESTGNDTCSKNEVRCADQKERSGAAIPTISDHGHYCFAMLEAATEQLKPRSVVRNKGFYQNQFSPDGLSTTLFRPPRRNL